MHLFFLSESHTLGTVFVTSHQSIVLHTQNPEEAEQNRAHVCWTKPALRQWLTSLSCAKPPARHPHQDLGS